MKRKWFILALLPLLFSGCLKESAETLILMGTEYYVKPVEDVIPDTLITFLDTLKLTLPTGNMPPDVQGEYVFQPRELLASNIDYVPHFSEVVRFRFGGDLDTVKDIYQDQHNRVVSFDYQEDALGLMHEDTVYLMGSGNTFTAYFTQKLDIQYLASVRLELTRAVAIFGAVSQVGIDSARIAFLNTDVRVVQNNSGASIPNEALNSMKGQIFVYQVENKGVAIRQNWYPR